MKNLFKLNQRIRIIPNDYKDLLYGVITGINISDFAVKPAENLSEDSLKTLREKPFEVSFTTANALIKFNSKITQVIDGNIYVAYPEEFKRIQRREYTRVNFKVPVKIFVDKENKIVYESNTINLSGGGMQFVSQQSLVEKSIVNARLQLSKNKVIETLFEILRVDEDKEAQKYLVSGAFKKISNIDRISIVQMCFKRQLELRCLGRLKKGGKSH